METIEILGSVLGLSFVAGIRLYATVLALGLAIRCNWLHLGSNMGALNILSHPAVLAASFVAFVAEFFVDKVPWVNSAWDTFHAFIRPIGAAVLAATALGSVDPTLKLVLIILCGGVAFASHSSKAATRFAVIHSPAHFGNVAISLTEDALVPLGVWLSLVYPVLAFVLVLVFLAGFAWVTPNIFRTVRLQVIALRVWLKRGNNTNQNGASQQLFPELKPDVSRALRIVIVHASQIPESHARSVTQLLGPTTPALGIQVAATKSIKGLRNSIGYLIIGSDDVAFVARRQFRNRIHRIKLAEVVHAEWKRGLLMNRFILRTPTSESAFYVFKDVKLES